jgi:hypothetical protein
MLSFESWHKLSRFVIKAADNACLSTLRSNKLRLDPKTSIHDPSSSPDEENRSGELMFSRSLWGNSELASFQDFLLKEECDKIYREVIKAFSGEIKAYVCELTYKADYLEEIPPLTWKDMVEKVSISFNNAKGPAITQSTVSRTISKFNKLFLEMVDKLEPGRRSMLANKICKVHQKPTNV